MSAEDLKNKKPKYLILFILFWFFHSLHCKKYKLKIQNVFKYLSGFTQGRNGQQYTQWRRL